MPPSGVLISVECQHPHPRARAMVVRFVHQVLIDSTVFGQGTVADLDDRTAQRLIASGAAEPAVREAVAVNPEVRNAARRVRRGG